MLTTVILEGVMGCRFGRVWNLSVGSPTEALRMIEANKPGLMRWVNEKRNLFSQYQVICEYESGASEILNEKTYGMKRRAKTIRFIPIIQGAGGVAKMVVGAIMVWASTFTGPFSAALSKAGWSLIVSGVIEVLTPMPKRDMGASSDELNSYYFDGPVNNSQQGAPVPLIYGQVLCGSQAVSAQLTIDRLV